MNRRLLVMMLCALAAPAYPMTAAVTSATQQAASPSAAGGSAKAVAATADSATRATTTNATSDTVFGKSAAPNAMSLTRPAAVLSAPGVPPMSTAPPVAKSTAARPRPSAILPSPVPKAGAAAPSPAGAAWTATGRESAAMHRGTLEAISAGPGTLRVFGQKLTFNPQRVKVFNRDGRPGSIYSLKSGAKVRFTMDSADPSRRRVAIIYVD
jgi:hypothetical protein